MKNIAPYSWNWNLWLWVLLCAIGIFSAVPVARSIQEFVYSTLGREFFTYIVLFAVGIGLTALLYLFILKLRVKRVSQFIWLFICAGLYVYFTLQLKTYPEEALHLIEYGLLSYFLFKALSHRIWDRTIYVTAIFFVLFVGTVDESLQWMFPGRYWDFKDVGLNMLGGGIFLLVIWKGIVPEIICKPVRKVSIKVLVGILTVDILFLGLCLSNTPRAVAGYTKVLNFLSWLRYEEPMTQYAYRYKDPDIGMFYSRLTLKELKKIDLGDGESFGKNLPADISSKNLREELIKIYNPTTNPFLYEFLIHVFQRYDSLDDLSKMDASDEKKEMANRAYKENLLLEKYFGNTLSHSLYILSDEKVKDLKKTASLWEGEYISKTGRIITFFSLETAWTVILIALVIIWTHGNFWKNRLDI